MEHKASNEHHVIAVRHSSWVTECCLGLWVFPSEEGKLKVMGGRWSSHWLLPSRGGVGGGGRLFFVQKSGSEEEKRFRTAVKMF